MTPIRKAKLSLAGTLAPGRVGIELYHCRRLGLFPHVSSFRSYQAREIPEIAHTE